MQRCEDNIKLVCKGVGFGELNVTQGGSNMRSCLALLSLWFLSSTVLTVLK